MIWIENAWYTISDTYKIFQSHFLPFCPLHYKQNTSRNCCSITVVVLCDRHLAGSSVHVAQHPDAGKQHLFCLYYFFKNSWFLRWATQDICWVDVRCKDAGSCMSGIIISIIQRLTTERAMYTIKYTCMKCRAFYGIKIKLIMYMIKVCNTLSFWYKEVCQVIRSPCLYQATLRTKVNYIIAVYKLPYSRKTVHCFCMLLWIHCYKPHCDCHCVIPLY